MNGSAPVTPALEAHNIQKVYGGTVALAGVDLTVAQGEIHGLLGENGAGKSTLVRILAALERADAGRIEVFGRELPAHATPATVAASGCAFLHQNLGLIDDLSVAENIAHSGGFAVRSWGINWRGVRAFARAALARLGLDELDVDALVADLSLSDRSMVAIARALAVHARVVVLDEPTATMHQSEVESLFRVLRRLSSDGVSFILISHRIDEVLQICDRVTVLRNGQVVAARSAAGLSERELAALIVGMDLDTALPETTGGARQQHVLDVEGIRVGAAGPLTFSVGRGEILGITGLPDAGHYAIGEALFGMRPLTAGSVNLGGRGYRPRRVDDAIRRGVAYVPADRAAAGVAAAFTLRENLFMNPSRRILSPLGARKERNEAGNLLRAFDVRPPEPDRELSTLSGGNQQKVLLAKWLGRDPKLLILNDPGAAVDVGAKVAIYRHLRARAAAQESGVLVISSDFEEIATVCDRALIMSRGRTRRTLEREQLSVQSVTRAAFGD